MKKSLNIEGSLQFCITCSIKLAKNLMANLREQQISTVIDQLDDETLDSLTSMVFDAPGKENECMLFMNTINSFDHNKNPFFF